VPTLKCCLVTVCLTLAKFSTAETRNKVSVAAGFAELRGGQSSHMAEPPIPFDMPSLLRQPRTECVRVLHARAVALLKNGRSAEAIPLLVDAVSVEPAQHDTRHDLAHAYLGAGRMTDALREFHEVATRFPLRSDSANNLAGVLSAVGEQAQAFHAVSRALALDPTNVSAMTNLAEILKSLGDWNGACDVYAAARELAPNDAKLVTQHGITLITLGRWKEGWPAFDARDRVPGAKVHSESTTSPRWDGRTSLDGKTILVTHEQGLGDAIMCVRFARDLASRGARVLLRCPAPLVRLLDDAPGVTAASAVNSSMPSHDVHIPAMSLPAAIAIDASQLDGLPYLTPPGECPAHVAALLPRDGVPTVAFCWSGNPQHINDARRSINGALLSPLLDVTGVRFVAMQKTPQMQHVLPQELHARLLDVGSACTDFAESAHALRRVDLVVSVDTAVAHLAGAIGTPTLLCTPFVPDYRWGLGASDTPWYRSITVLRQPTLFAWQPVLDEVQRRITAIR